MNLAIAAAVLREAGVASPEWDAAELSAHVRGTRRGVPGELTPAQEAEFDALVARRAAREPLQHLVGSVGFRYLDIAVGTGVFIPRPETELVVQAALDAVRDLAAPLCVDLCAGSGAIALSLAHEHPGALVHAVEASTEAYAWLERNAAAVAALPPRGRSRGEPGGADCRQSEAGGAPGVSPEGGIALHLGDALTALPELDGRCDVVVSNPPYLPPDSELDTETAGHDPALALWGGGADGLDFARALAPRALALLRPGGMFVMEHDATQGVSAPAVLRAAGFVEVADHADLAGRPRFATGVGPHGRMGG